MADYLKWIIKYFYKWGFAETVLSCTHKVDFIPVWRVVDGVYGKDVLLLP